MVVPNRAPFRHEKERERADVLHGPGVGRPPSLALLPSLGPRAIRSVTRFSGPGAAARGEAELTS